MFEKVSSILADYADVSKDTITEETTLIDDLGLSSLDLAELVGVIEDEYSVFVQDEDVLQLRTVGDVCNLIKDLEQK